MKKTVQIIAFGGLTLAILALSACSTDNDQPQNQAANQQNTQQNPASEKVTPDQAKVDDATNQAMIQPAYTEADQAAYGGAMQLKDVTYCDKIKDEAYKQQCKTELADNATLAAALEKLDPALCDKMSTDDKKEACKIQVDVAKKKVENQQQKQQEIENISAAATEIIQTGDYAKCRELADPNFTRTCEVNILSKQAIESGDVKICGKVSDEQGKNICQSIFNDSSQESKSQE